MILWLLALVGQIHLTVYSGGFAQVEETRSFSLQAGTQVLETPDLPLQVDLTTVMLDLPGAQVQQKQVLYALARPQAVEALALERPVRVHLQSGEILKGRLIGSAADALVLQTPEGLLTVARKQVLYWQLQDAPPGLRARPVVRWTVEARRTGTTEGTLRYQTQGLTWQALYTVVVKEKRLDLKGFVHLSNTSGRTYENARIVLIAGEVHRAARPAWEERGVKEMAVMAAPAPNYPSERAFAEYHRYDLPGTYTLHDHQDLQVRLLTAHNLPLEERYVYRSGEQVEWHLRFVNPQAPMPAGRVQVYRQEDDHLLFVGEDLTSHRARGDTVQLFLGRAFDLKARETVEEAERLGPGWWERTVAVTLWNLKSNTVKVQVVRTLPEGFELVESSQPPSRKTARTLEFWVAVPAGGKTVLRYTVRSRS